MGKTKEGPTSACCGQWHKLKQGREGGSSSAPELLALPLAPPDRKAWRADLCPLPPEGPSLYSSNCV